MSNNERNDRWVVKIKAQGPEFDSQYQKKNFVKARIELGHSFLTPCGDDHWWSSFSNLQAWRRSCCLRFLWFLALQGHTAELFLSYTTTFLLLQGLRQGMAGFLHRHHRESQFPLCVDMCVCTWACMCVCLSDLILWNILANTESKKETPEAPQEIIWSTK